PQAEKRSHWSHEPFCKYSKNLVTVGKKFCTYTTNTTGLTGVSVIVTPSLAARIAKDELLENDPAHNFLPLSLASKLKEDPPWSVREVPGKGMGVFAARRIERFETVMVDQASVLEDIDAEKALSTTEEREMLARAFKQLKFPEALMNMSAEHARREERGQLEADIMVTNSFGTEIDGTNIRALFPQISRINHECNPNSFVLISRTGTSMAVKAYREIEPGEELNISCMFGVRLLCLKIISDTFLVDLRLGHTFARRQGLIKSKWGFTCTCSLCSLSHAEKTASDIRRTLIKQIDNKIVELWQEGHQKEALSLAEESIEIVKDEGLNHFLPSHYALLAKLWLMLGKRDKAEGFGRKGFGMLVDMGYLGHE
ncbi:hypothetical protein BCR34DRAFT_441204, partial [Clohesyomyces aquaticus]